ncbi:hypothetical protein QIS99_29635 [Streptomyces sp. B-S-A8]|uniref:Uncharacterized protein n=1 Tax=Streptomyces solicavernae TaxID=3043614 RepID=A0ABT6S0Y3_9ACTN|nr:hypothetical protein [Streptomyces sp. B-S-A8]MDI3390322.1 hypothetical protein [Streptomyces sp. B-S-A8]
MGRIRRLGAVASRLGGCLLLLVGAYVAYYGWYEIRVLRGGSVADPVIDAAGTAQRWPAEGLNGIGVPGIAVALALLLLTALMLHPRRARRDSGPADEKAARQPHL